MHPSSIVNMEKARNHKYVHFPEKIKVLDVGGRDLNGKDRSYKTVFEDIAETYYTADIVDGDGVTHPMPGPYELPFADNTFDLIVSGQTLEHVQNPFKSVREMKRVLKPNAYIILIAPSSGPRHDEIDCWRIMDDGFKAIAKDVGLKVVADWVDRDAPDERSRRWNDHVFIGQKPLWQED